ncbi:ankyrin repeat-containing domain protein [Stachybotrys elegans]|uniref:Ankyrin repeat-containing domain protein n=1 Tax=Stachybotrys elegans TaxID=80388 RepID=A0A8K0SNQ9_9HYPO|nr:ankyrin repeat-containing domain protein [Stachybotrys elegans]
MSPRRQKIPDAEWDKHRPEIIRLYTTASLKNVRKQMLEQHHFDASISQYESRLRQWDIRKNRKKKEWEIILDADNSSIPSSDIRNGLPPVLRGDKATTVRRAMRWARARRSDLRAITQQDHPSAAANFVAIESPSQIVHTCTGDMQEMTVPPLSPRMEQLLDSWCGYVGSASTDPRPGLVSRTTNHFERNGSSNLIDGISPFQRSSVIRNQPSIFPYVRFLLDRLHLPVFLLQNSWTTLGIELPVCSVCSHPCLRFNDKSNPPWDLFHSSPQGDQVGLITRMLWSLLTGSAGLGDGPEMDGLNPLDHPDLERLFLRILDTRPSHISTTVGRRIFHAAIRRNDRDAVDLLLKQAMADGSKLSSIHSTFQPGRAPISLAVECRASKVVNSLLLAGAHVDRIRGIEVKGDYIVITDIPRDGLCEYFIEESWKIILILLTSKASVRVTARAVGAVIQLSKGNLVLAQELALSIWPPDHGELIAELESLFHGPDESGGIRILDKICDICQETCGQCMERYKTKLEDAVIVAARNGHCTLVKHFIERTGILPLNRIFIAAIQSGDGPLLRFIMSLEPRLDPPADMDSGCVTPLSEAVRCGNQELIDTLEMAGAHMHLAEGGRFKPLMEAAAEVGDVTYLQRLLDRALTSKESFRPGSRALCLALQNDCSRAVQLLLDAGVGLRFEGVDDNDPLAVAFEKESVQFIHQILDRTSSVSFRCMRYAVRWGDKSLVRELAPIFLSPEIHVSIEEARRALENEILPSLCTRCMQDNDLKFFRTFIDNLILVSWELDFTDCLVVAIKAGHSDMVDFLLERKCDPFHVDIMAAASEPDRVWMHPSLFAPKCCNSMVSSETIEYLLRTQRHNTGILDILLSKHKVNLNILMPSGGGSEMLTPLYLAIRESKTRKEPSLEVASKFIGAGSDPNATSRLDFLGQAETALMVAIREGCQEMVELLIRRGADVNMTPKFNIKKTPLQYAAGSGRLDMVRLLLSYRADVNGEPALQGGATALQFAAISGNCNVALELLDAGAKLDALPSRIDGRWPLEGAAEHGRLDMIQLLWGLKSGYEDGGTKCAGFSDRHCLRAMKFAQNNGHLVCRDLVSRLSHIPVERLETDEYGAEWIAY